MKAITWMQLPLGAMLIVVGGTCVINSKVVLLSNSSASMDVVLCLLGLVFFAEGTSKSLKALSVLTKRGESPSVKSVEDRIDELERLKRRDMVTPEEYSAKRQEILKDL
jgi:hypothetical protein